MANVAETKKEAVGASLLNAGTKGVRFAGVDDGHSGIKVVTDDWREVFLPSRIAMANTGIDIGADTTGNNWYQTEDGQQYVIAANLPFVDTRFNDYAVSNINRVLVAHALVLAGLGGQDVRIMTGLPVGDYYIANQPNRDFIDRKKKSLLDSRVLNKNDKVALANITHHNVSSEAIAAFFDLLIDENGDTRPEIVSMVETGSLGIVDIGGKTTDSAVVIDGGRTIDAARSGTDNIGGLSLHKSVEPRLKDAFNAKALSPHQIDEAVRTGVLRVFGADKDCSEIIQDEKRKLARQIIEATERKIGDGADLESVFFVGGGSILLHDQLADLFPHGQFVERPQFANARGMLKAVKFLQPH